MHVFNLIEPFEKELEVVTLCKTGKLRGIVQPHVDDPQNSGVMQLREEVASGFFGEADRKCFNALGVVTHLAPCPMTRRGPL
jgi:hypothetical protein